MKRNVLFVCTHNSCRSQMAEGLVNHFLQETWQACSAGMEATYVHPEAVHVMGEIGIDISGQRSKSLEHVPYIEFDLVITLCSDAEQNCPLYVGTGKRIHVGFDDPAAATGTEEEVRKVFRRIRDQIKERISAVLKTYDAGSSQVGIHVNPAIRNDEK